MLEDWCLLRRRRAVHAVQPLRDLVHLLLEGIASRLLDSHWLTDFQLAPKPPTQSCDMRLRHELTALLRKHACYTAS